MKTVITSLFLTSVFLSILTTIYSDEGKQGFFEQYGSFYNIISEHFLNIIPIMELQSTDILACIFRCFEHNGCRGANYNNRQSPGLHVCQLLGEGLNGRLDKLTRKDGWEFYENTHNGIYSSCATALKENRNRNGSYWIQATNNTAEIEITCERRGHDAVAIIDHNTEDRTLVTGYEAPGLYNKQINYTKLASVEALIDSSFSCRQFAKFECNDMVFTYENGNAFGWLEGRGGKSIWGNRTTGGVCACGLTNSCYYTNKKCNCDANTNKWLNDEVYITVKSYLPITGIRLGDTGADSEKAYHTVGKIECVQH